MPLDGVSISQLPLPEGWTLSECVDDTVDADGLSIRRMGLCATSEHAQAIGSAADVLEDPAPRARFELLERIAIAEAQRPSSERRFRVRSSTGDDLGTARLEDVFPPSDAPDRWAFSRSNGVSLNVGWSQACAGAERELVERDRVMRAWLGETVPVRMGDRAGPLISGARSYEWRTYVFPPPEAPAIGGNLEVVGVFGFPLVEGRSLVSGYGARADRAEAELAAQKEALQLLAFLWGEPLPDRAPDPLPVPMTHLETYQMRDRHPVLRHWLDEGHVTHHRPSRADTGADRSLRFADLTPPWLEGHLHVARALCPAATPLIFGLSPLLAHLPPELRIHPIA